MLIPFFYIFVFCVVFELLKTASIYLNLSSEMRQKIKDCHFCVLCAEVHPHAYIIASWLLSHLAAENLQE